MVYHEWGDEDFDWDALYKAGALIADTVGGYYGAWFWWKEKYGTLRHNLVLPYTFIEILAPFRWRFSRIALVHRIDYALSDTWLGRKIINYINDKQQRLYYKAVKNAVSKYPHVAEEILDDLSFWVEDIEDLELRKMVEHYCHD